MTEASEKKFPESQRTFETRLLFIREIFSDLHSPEEIMAQCITHKLDRSYLRYVQSLDKSMANLTMAEPLKILRTMKMEND